MRVFHCTRQTSRMRLGDIRRRRALVETRRGILSKAKLALRPLTILASLTRRQGASIKVPLRGTPLTPRRLAEFEVCFEPHKKTLDNAADVIHGT
jgi:hypothetical protein